MAGNNFKALMPGQNSGNQIFAVGGNRRKEKRPDTTPASFTTTLKFLIDDHRHQHYQNTSNRVPSQSPVLVTPANGIMHFPNPFSFPCK
jgi:hypothetical protein